MTAQANISNLRRLPLEGTPNLRDLGGYRTADGRQTRWGRLFRAGRLSALTDADKQTLAQYDLRLICDFRREDEYQRDATDLGNHEQISIHNLAINPGDHSGAIASVEMSEITADDMAQFMVMINREFALQQTGTYRRMFELLLDTETGGFLFHCSAGKDRTGFAAALILAALGVDRDTIMHDYMLTAEYYPPKGELEYLAGKYASPGMDLSVFQAMVDTREEYLAAAFDAIDENFDSMDHYLATELALDDLKRQRLVDRYVE